MSRKPSANRFYNAVEYPIEYHRSPKEMRARHKSFNRSVQTNSSSSSSLSGPGTPVSRVANAAARSMVSPARLQEKRAIERRLARLPPASREMRDEYRRRALYRLNMQKKQAEMNRLANAMNLGWTGAATRMQRQQAAGPAARARWKVAGSGAQFLAAASSAWDAIDALLRNQGGITGTTQKAISAYAAQTWEEQRWPVVTEGAAIAVGAACGVPRFIALGAGKWMRDSIGAACQLIDTRVPGFKAKMKKLEKAVEAGAMGVMTPVWKTVGPAVVSLFPLQIFLWLFKGLIERQFIPSHVAKLINWKVIDAAIGRHKRLIGKYLSGKRVDMKPVAMAVAGATNRCAVFHVIHKVLPGFQLHDEC